jgi:peptidoglycan/LPS O-acetylase OafA/YrhL
MHFTTPKNHRFLFLDALRGVAALFVVFFHFPKVMTSSFAANGMLAVDFFFCLSGFVIAFSYENRLNETLSFRDFAVARWIRLYPIYALGSLIGLFIGILVQHFVFHGGSWSSWLALFGLAAFWWPTRLSPVKLSINYPLNGPAWSLFYEIFANFVYALFVKLRVARTPVLLCIVAGNLALLVKTVVSGGKLDVGPTQANFGLGFARVAFSFFFGVLIYRFYRFRKKNAGDNDRIWWLLPLILTLVLIGIFDSPFSWMSTEGFRLIAISLCFPVIVYCGAVARLPHRFTRLSAMLGELSYPLYLLHMPFVSLMDARHIEHFAVTHVVLVRCIVFCIVAILAPASWWIGEHVDVPIRRALTRRYNAYKQNNLTPISLQTSTPAQRDDA